jgi:anaerobic selenocysteine-containing dehydrogenase
MALREAKSFCRICPGYCGVILSIDENDRIVKVRGDRADPMSQGYVCIKGIESPHLYHGPQRLTNPLKRMADGSFAKIGLEQALDEIAEKLTRIIARDGPDAVGLFKGGNAYQAPLPAPFIAGFLKAIGSTSLFTSNTIDQSAKAVSADRAGSWAAGRNHLGNADVLVIFGANPLVAISMFGFDAANPMKRLKAFKDRGGKLIVIDPRRTETARFADLLIQPRPGEDIAIAAGMLRLILSQGWEDKAFCAQYVDQIEQLRRAVEPFTPEYVAQRADIDAAALRQASDWYAHAARGVALSGTGPNMSARSNLTQHMIDCLDIVRGNFLREGDAVPNPGLQGQPPRRAQVNPPGRCWEKGAKSRVRGLGFLFGEKMTGALAEEIMTPGPGQVKAFIVDGGNPGASVPDQKQIIDAFRSLELMVTIDPEMTNTAKVAHYILPPKLQFEHPSVYGLMEFETLLIQRPAQHYAPAAIACPPGSELVDDWYVFWALAKRLGKQLYFDDVPLDMSTKPDDDYLLSLFFRNGPVSFDEIKKYPSGHVFKKIKAEVQAALPNATGRFEAAPADVVAELAEVMAESPVRTTRAINGEPCDLMLISRRLREVFNSAGRTSPEIRKRQPFNAAYLHPAELKARGLATGDRVEIASDHGAIPAVVKSDATLRNGVVSMTHGWGGLPGENSYEEEGSSTSLLVSAARDCEKINAMPRMSAIPVNVRRVGESRMT